MCARKALLNEGSIKDQLLTHYGIEIDEIEEIDKGEMSCSFKLSCAKFSDRFYFLKEPLSNVPADAINVEAELLHFLKLHDIPVTDFIKTLNGNWYFEYGKKYIILQNFISGDEYSRRDIPEKLLAPTLAMLGKINTSLTSYKLKPRKGWSVSYCETYKAQDIANKLEKNLQNLGNIDIDCDEFEKASKATSYLQEIQPKLKEYGLLFKYLTYTPSHGDYHVDNLIYDKDEIVAVVDWTSSSSMPAGFNLMLLGLDFGTRGPGIKSIDLSNLVKNLHEYTAHAPLNYYDYKLMPYAYLHIWGRTAAPDRVKRYIDHKVIGNNEIAKRKLRVALRAVSICQYLEKNADIMSRQLEKYYESTLSKSELRCHRRWLKKQDHMKWIYEQECVARRKRTARRIIPFWARKLRKGILLNR
jgi:thiamine kinase-like enzyme